MNLVDAVQRLDDWDKVGRCVYALKDLRLVMRNDDADPHEDMLAFNLVVKSLLSRRLLVHVAHGLYVYPHWPIARVSSHGYVLGQIVNVLREGRINYVSLESLLSGYGLMVQSPKVLTVITTGYGGYLDTPYGAIEFVRTNQPRQMILDSTIRDPKSPLRVATVKCAMSDMARAGRSVAMIDKDMVALLIELEEERLR